MKISKSRLKEIIKEEIKHVLKEEDYDTLRDKGGRVRRKPSAKRKIVADSTKVYLDVSDSEGKKLQKKYRGRIFKDKNKNAWYMPVSKSLRAIDKDIKQNMDTKLTDKGLQKRVNNMKTV